MDHIKAYIPDAIWYDIDTVSKVAFMISETFKDNSNTKVLGVHGDYFTRLYNELIVGVF